MPDKEIFELYGGEVRLEYTDKTHRYRASVAGGKPEHCPSVTTILNVLAKPALIEWGVKCACNDIEENLRALFAGSSFTEQQILNIVTRGRTAHDRVRDEAAEIGTNVHDILASWWKSQQDLGDGVNIKSLVFDTSDERVSKCVHAALSWFSEHDLKPVSVEEPQYSKLHNFCGRPDWIGQIDGSLSVLDYKSTKSLYPEVALQMSAYGLMHHEMRGEKPVARYALRLDKESGEFEARKYTDNDRDEETFFACLKIYDRLKHLRRKPKPEPKEDFLAEL